MLLFAERGVSLKPHTTLKSGGSAEFFAVAKSVDDLAEWASHAQKDEQPTTYLGWGSNVLPSDAGVPGLVIVNEARHIEISADGAVIADTGCGFQELFLKTAQANLSGLEFAVGIPGTLGGALVSNAGAYRSCISESVVAIEVVVGGERRWVEPAFLEFSYRDSILRRNFPPPPICLLRVKLQLSPSNGKTIYDSARDFQRQRIGKQPPPASAGSFFKNVNDTKLAESLPGLTEGMRKAGVVPSGFLIEAVGLKGFRFRGAMLSRKHANFIINIGDASATDIRNLAEHAKRVVHDRFGVTIEEEVLYLGNWTNFKPESIS